MQAREFKLNDLVFFIKNFIQKERQDRWIEFLGKGRGIFWAKLPQLERHLNSKCRLVENNSGSEMVAYAQNNGITNASYYDKYTCGMAVVFPDFEIRQDSFIINRDKQCAFYVHPEGWIWICKV